MWMLPLYLHVNQKSDYDDDDMMDSSTDDKLMTFSQKIGFDNTQNVKIYFQEKIRKNTLNCCLLFFFPAF